MNKERTLDRAVFKAFPNFTWEKLIVSLIIILAILSRFIMIGSRVMSHDEVNHVVPAYNFYQGQGYSHDPVTHGPFQFHMLALSYFLFGDSDFSSRIPAAVFSVAAIIFILFSFRRYLGRIGTLIAGGLFLISPYILFYGRYTRNEAFIELFAVLTFYAFLRYYEKRDDFSLYLLATVTALQFTTKEVAFIYCAQFLLFCGFLFLKDLWEMNWDSQKKKNNAAALVLCTMLLFLLAALTAMLFKETKIPMLLCAGFGIVLMFGAIFYIVKALGWKQIGTSPTYNLIAFLGCLILPQLTAFPVKLIGWNPLDYSTAGILRTGAVLLFITVISFALGCRWNKKVFLRSAAIFYSIFIFFYTTIFSNGQGFFTGIIGSLGYWLSQQDVQRGSQPLYYYALIQLPVYEFAAIFGTVLSIIFAARHHRFWGIPGEYISTAEPVELSDEQDEQTEIPEEIIEEITEIEPIKPTKIPTLIFFLYWSLSSLIAYSAAGEKMPWLSVHIAMPLAMSAAWGLGWLWETLNHKKVFTRKGLIITLTFCLLVTSAFGFAGSLGGVLKPFASKDLEGLKVTFRFVFSLIAFLLSGCILSRMLKSSDMKVFGKYVTLLVMILFIILQARTAFTASFINYDYANELLVYAHAAPGPKVILNQIEEIAARTGEGKNIKVAYDNDALYPFWWYLRDYKNKNYFGDGNPTRDLRNYDIIVANISKDGRMEPIVKDDYYRYEYMRLWWPNQSYFNLSFGQIMKNLLDPQMRSALFRIWLNRDYSKFANVTGKTNLTPETWEPSAKLSVYIRKDVMRKMWMLMDENLLVEPTADEGTEDDEKFSQLDPQLSIGGTGNEEGQFNKPRGVAVSRDGERVYVLDSDNNRVQYFAASDGSYLGQWNNAANNGFNQPWGIDCGPDGSVYIADTWNHRMLKFSTEGEFITEWYSNDPGEHPMGFYGPRSVAVSENGRVYVTDTGNKRIMVYDENGNYLTKFGTGGMGMGELDEPVGIALIDDNHLAVADTWNQRVQVFNVSNLNRVDIDRAFDVSAWYTQSLENKPYLAAQSDGTIFISDPEGSFVMQYDAEGKLVRSFNGGGGSIDRYSMPIGLSFSPDGSLWVVDAQNSQLNQFILK